MEQGSDLWCWFDTTQFLYHCVHPIHAKMFSIQMLLHFSQIVQRVCTLVLFIVSCYGFRHVHWFVCVCERMSQNRTTKYKLCSKKYNILYCKKWCGTIIVSEVSSLSVKWAEFCYIYTVKLHYNKPCLKRLQYL